MKKWKTSAKKFYVSFKKVNVFYKINIIELKNKWTILNALPDELSSTVDMREDKSVKLKTDQ